MRAQIVTVGDEILIGKIVDTNSAWLGNELTTLGIQIEKVTSIADKDYDIKKALAEGLESSDLILMTGGLGPTKDDITKKAIAEFLGVGFYFEKSLYDMIVAYFEMRGIPLTEAHKEQCYMPEGVQLLENKMGTAPGMLFKFKGKYILSMPGVPYEMKWIFEHSFKEILESINPDKQKIYHRTIRTIGIGETSIAKNIEDITNYLPQDISVSFLTSLGHVKLRLTKWSYDDPKEEVDKYTQVLAERLSEYVFGFDDMTIEESLLRDFTDKKLTLAVAESCTGGFLSHRLTSVPGSSKYFLGGYVTYAYDVKETSLDVKNSTLTKYGAVSEETVKEMLNGILNRVNADVGISISGIAGPGGGTPDKPVGTIWLAWGNKETQHTEKIQLGKSRMANIEYTAVTAMNKLRLFIMEN